MRAERKRKGGRERGGEKGIVCVCASVLLQDERQGKRSLGDCNTNRCGCRLRGVYRMKLKMKDEVEEEEEDGKKRKRRRRENIKKE